jgi:hypothetical protein
MGVIFCSNQNLPEGFHTRYIIKGDTHGSLKRELAKTLTSFLTIWGVFKEKEEKRSVLLQILLQKKPHLQGPLLSKFQMRELFKQAPPKR